MAARYKQLCSRCKKNYVEVNWRQRVKACYECQKKEMGGEVTDPKMKKLFNVPEEFYKKNAFLRNIKIAYNRYGSLSEKQIEAFKRTVKELKEKAKA